MKTIHLLAPLIALTCAANVYAANDFTDITADTLTPKYGQPITLTFQGLNSGSCGVSISSNVFNFGLQNGGAVDNGKLTFVPTSMQAPIHEGFSMTVGGSNYGNGCHGPAKTFQFQVNASMITAVSSEINVVAKGKPVNVLVYGIEGRSCDGAALNFGDGTPPMQLTGVFPITASHVYSQPGSYKQSATGNGTTCYGQSTSEFATKVLDDEGMTKISTLQISNTNPEFTAYKLTVNGPAGGSCERALVEWGDGTSPEPVSGNFPLTATHQYQSGGTVTVKAEAAAGFKCSGLAKATFYTYPKDGKFTALPSGIVNGKINQDLPLELTGTGICNNVTVALGDNLTIVNLGKVLFNPYNNYKWPFKVKYSKAGNYTLYIKDNGTSACGILTPKVTIGEPLQFNMPVLMPATPVSTPPATPPKPATPKPTVPPKPCVKKNGQQVDPNCVAE